MYIRHVYLRVHDTKDKRISGWQANRLLSLETRVPCGPKIPRVVPARLSPEMLRVPKLCPSLKWIWLWEGNVRDNLKPLDRQNGAVQCPSRQGAEILSLQEFVWLMAMFSFCYKGHWSRWGKLRNKWPEQLLRGERSQNSKVHKDRGLISYISSSWCLAKWLVLAKCSINIC